MEFETLLLSDEGAVATITTNRPESLNALNAQMFTDLKAAFAHLATRGEIRAIVVRGSGERAFVAGADIKEMTDMAGGAAEQRSWNGMHLYDQIRHQPQPVRGQLEALGTHCHLLQGFLSGDIERLHGIGQVTHGLQQQGTLAGAGVATEQDCRARYETAAQHPIKLSCPTAEARHVVEFDIPQHLRFRRRAVEPR